MGLVSLMRGGEPLVSKLAALSLYVVYPSAIIAYSLYVPEGTQKKKIDSK